MDGVEVQSDHSTGVGFVIRSASSSAGSGSHGISLSCAGCNGSNGKEVVERAARLLEGWRKAENGNLEPPKVKGKGTPPVELRQILVLACIDLPVPDLIRIVKQAEHLRPYVILQPNPLEDGQEDEVRSPTTHHPPSTTH